MLSREEPAVSTLRESAAPASSEAAVIRYIHARHTSGLLEWPRRRLAAQDHETGHPKMPSKGSVDTCGTCGLEKCRRAQRGQRGPVLRRTPSSSNRSGSTDRDAEQSRAEAKSPRRAREEREEQSGAVRRLCSALLEELPGAVALPPDRPMGKASGAQAEPLSVGCAALLCVLRFFVSWEAPLPPPLPPANLEPIGDEAGHPRLQNYMSMKWHKVGPPKMPEPKGQDGIDTTSRPA